MGIKTPFVKEGDDVVSIVTNSVLESVLDVDSVEGDAKYDINDKDIIGITESLVARAAGLYVTVDDIAEDIKNKFGENPEITLMRPIYSRNRFAMILKGIARAAKKITILMPEFDEVGNPSGLNPFTGVNIQDYYTEICKKENCQCVVMDYNEREVDKWGVNWIYCGLHDYGIWGRHPYLQKITCYTLAEICSDKNPDFGVLGSNKATEERLKLFPTKELANDVCARIKAEIGQRTGKDVLVCVYGDGCFKDPVGNIWEFADPITMPGYTNPEIFESTPNEIKLKALIDQSASFAEVRKVLYTKKENLKGNMASQGTTPRLYRDLIASLCDLTSASGDKGTPVVLIKNYFKSYLD